MTEIKHGDKTYRDIDNKIHEDAGGNITCCGKQIIRVSCWDGLDSYGITYNCKCGNVIEVIAKREKAIKWDE